MTKFIHFFFCVSSEPHLLSRVWSTHPTLPYWGSEGSFPDQRMVIEPTQSVNPNCTLILMITYKVVNEYKVRK